MTEIRKLIYSTKNNLAKIMQIVITTLIVVFIYSYFIAEKSFISDSKLFIYGEQSSVGELKSLALQYGVNVPGSSGQSNLSSPELFMSIGTSREVLKELIDTKFFVNGNEVTLKQHLSKNKERYDEEVFKNLRKRVGTSLDRRAGIINMSVSMNNPVLSMEVNRKLIDIINERFLDIKKLETSKKKLFIKDRIKALTIDLNNSEQKIKEFKELNRSISTSPELTLELNRLNRNNKVIEQVYILLKEQLETTKIEEIEKTQPLVIIDNPNIPYKKSAPSTLYNLIYMLLLSSFLSIYYFYNKER